MFIDERILPHRVQSLSEYVIVVIQPGVAHARIGGHVVMLLDPAHRRLDPGIVGAHAGVDHALQAGIGHRAVAPQAPFGGFVGHAHAPGGRGIVKAAVGVLGGKFGGVVFAFQVLAAGDEDQSLLHGRVVGTVAGRPQGIDQEAGVREVGPLSLAIAGAAVFHAVGIFPQSFAPLGRFHVAVGSTDQLFVPAVAIGRGETHDCHAGLIVAVESSLLIDPPIGMHKAFQIFQTFGNQRVVGRQPNSEQACRNHGRHAGAGGGRERAVGGLPLDAEKVHRSIHRTLISLQVGVQPGRGSIGRPGGPGRDSQETPRQSDQSQPPKPGPVEHRECSFQFGGKRDPSMRNSNQSGGGW